jgi:hypothetical protein
MLPRTFYWVLALVPPMLLVLVVDVLARPTLAEP